MVTSSCAEHLQAGGSLCRAPPFERLAAPTAITCPCPCRLPACIPATGVQGPPAKSAAVLSTSLVLAMGNPHFYSNYYLFSLPHEVQGCHTQQQLTDRPAVAFDLQIKKGCLSWCMFWHICQVLINFITVTSGFKTASFFGLYRDSCNFIKTAVKV